jgi:hypothetical protein
MDRRRLRRCPSLPPSAGALLLAALLLACAGGPRTRASSVPAALASQELGEPAQTLTTFRLALAGEVESPEVEARLVRADWQLVSEGEVVGKGQTPLDVAVPAGGKAAFTLTQEGRFADSPGELAQLLEKGGTLLAALRGELVLERGGKEERLPFGRSRELRVPRLPTVKLEDLEGARYGPERVVVTLSLGVLNPNPFPVRLGSLTWKAELGGKALEEGALGKGGVDVGPSRTRSFELQLELDPQTYGPGAKALIGSRRIPYRIRGAAEGELWAQPFDLRGEVQLNAPRP